MTNDITHELAETLKELRTKFDARQHLGPSMVRVDAALELYEDACNPKMTINLKDYANKLVVVTLRNEWMLVSLVNTNVGYDCYPYSIDGKNYGIDGQIFIGKESPYDIIDIKLAEEDPEPVITRVEVITDTREYVHWNPYNKITTSLQDDGKTLKVFVNKVKEDIDIIKESRQTGRTGTTTNKLLEKAFYEQITEIEEPEMPITKPEFYDSLTPGDKTRYNVAEEEVSNQWSLALARLIDEIGEEAPSYSEWDAMRTSPEKLVEYLRELMKYREQLVADEELEACCAVMEMNEGRVSGNVLRAIRRPKPTLKSQALKDFETVRKHSDLLPEILDTIENALKSLPDT
jgi:predicted DNA-binding ribbon-helix-helix protein